jgi:hypothetical protein
MVRRLLLGLLITALLAASAACSNAPDAIEPTPAGAGGASAGKGGAGGKAGAGAAGKGGGGGAAGSGDDGGVDADGGEE